MTAPSPDDQLTTADVAELAGLEPGTIKRYRYRGSIPPPDGWLGRTPWWRRDTVDRWLEERTPRDRARQRRSAARP